MTMHDFLLVFAWPVLTATLNLLLSLAGQSDKPYAKMFAKYGTVLRDAVKKA